MRNCYTMYIIGVLFLLSGVASANSRFIPLHESNLPSYDQPQFEDPVLCHKAVDSILATGGAINDWFKQVLYGPETDRVLESGLARALKERLVDLAKEIAENGRKKYAAARVHYGHFSSDQMCSDYINEWNIKLNSTMQIIFAEVDKGNRYLIDTGANSLLGVDNP